MKRQYSTALIPVCCRRAAGSTFRESARARAQTRFETRSLATPTSGWVEAHFQVPNIVCQLTSMQFSRGCCNRPNTSGPRMHEFDQARFNANWCAADKVMR